jgi:hypothetical protein
VDTNQVSFALRLVIWGLSLMDVVSFSQWWLALISSTLDCTIKLCRAPGFDKQVCKKNPGEAGTSRGMKGGFIVPTSGGRYRRR